MTLAAFSASIMSALEDHGGKASFGFPDRLCLIVPGCAMSSQVVLGAGRRCSDFAILVRGEISNIGGSRLETALVCRREWHVASAYASTRLESASVAAWVVKWEHALGREDRSAEEIVRLG